MTIRWGRASSDGTVVTVSHIRWGRAATDGTVAVIVTPIATQSNLEPETTVSLTATLQGGGTADSWAWRRVSGPSVAIAATGPSVTVTAPSDINGATLVLGVTATIALAASDTYSDTYSNTYGGGNVTTSPEVTVTLNVLPQTEWWWTGTGWIPRIETWAA